jgi:hypothetical protein
LNLPWTNERGSEDKGRKEARKGEKGRGETKGWQDGTKRLKEGAKGRNTRRV